MQGLKPSGMLNTKPKLNRESRLPGPRVRISGNGARAASTPPSSPTVLEVGIFRARAWRVLTAGLEGQY